MISFKCPHCAKPLRVKEELAGRQGQCPQCHKTIEIPQPGSAAGGASSAAYSPDQIRQQLGAGFQGKLTLPHVGMAYKLGALIVLGVLLLMPLFYAGVIGAVAYGMYWLAAGSFGLTLPPSVFWTAEAAAALVLLCLLKPLIEPQRRRTQVYRKALSEEPLLGEMLTQICQQLDAPQPKTVEWECSTRLAASGKSGGVLTIGLPLVACLSADEFAAAVAGQLALVRRGAAPKVTNRIRGINGWLWRSVYGLSRFDRWLAVVAQRPHFHLAKLLLPLRACRFVAQAVLFVPMFVANTIGGYVVQRAELDADRIAARLAGRKAFAALVEKTESADFAWEGILAELDFLRRDQALPSSLPDELALRMRDMTPDVVAALRETVKPLDEKPFDTKATMPERLAAASHQPASGVFHLPLSARLLVADYEALAQKMSWDYYVARFGPQFLQTATQPAPAGAAAAAPTAR